MKKINRYLNNFMESLVTVSIFVVIPVLLVILFCNSLYYFKSGDCIQNDVNGRVGIVRHVVDNKYIVDFETDEFEIPRSMQINFTKVNCYGIK